MAKKPAFRKILVISHDDSLTGAPILLLRLMNLLKEEGYSFNTLIVNSWGPLKASFEEISGKCIVYKSFQARDILSKIKGRLRPKHFKPDIRPVLKDVDLVLSNTITNGEILTLVRRNFNVPVISYVHELEITTAICTTRRALQQTLALTDHFIIPCRVLKNFLQQDYKIPHEKVSVLNYLVPAVQSYLPEDIVQFKKDNFIDASFIIGALGSKEWRKGTDVFIIIASQVLKKLPDADIQFIWMGGEADIEHKKMLHDIKKLGLEKRIIIITASPLTILFYKSIDLFLLPSREDPYPLVVLEAASAEIPTVCFNDGGGAPEFVEDDAGCCIPYLNILTMVDVIVSYYESPHLLHSHGSNAFQKVKRLHQDKQFILSQFKEVLNAIS